MKPTERQIKVIDTILSIIETWKNSNDINSPTHTVDIYKIIASQWTLWAIPKKPSCLFDEVIVNIAKKPELALKQNIVENNGDFWRKAYE